MGNSPAPTLNLQDLYAAAVSELARQLLGEEEVKAETTRLADRIKSGGSFIYSDQYGHRKEFDVKQQVAEAMRQRLQQLVTAEMDNVLAHPDVQKVIHTITAEAVLQTMKQIPQLIGQQLAQRILVQTDPYRQPAEIDFKMDNVVGALNETRDRLGLPRAAL